MEKPRHPIRLRIVGHVDCGKSTLLGRLLCDFGIVSPPALERTRRTARELGKESFFLSMIADSVPRPCSFETARHVFEIDEFAWRSDVFRTLSNADVAVIAIGAPQGEFEAGISRDGQTREFIRFAFAIGVPRFLFVVNKMDDRSVKYSRERFEEIATEVQRMFFRVGYPTEASVGIVPISAFFGENIVGHSSQMPWFTGQTLLEALDSIEEQVPRDSEKPLRVSVSEASASHGNARVFGTVNSGTLIRGSEVVMAPHKAKGIVEKIEVGGEEVERASARDTATFLVSGISSRDIRRGAVFGDPRNDPPEQTLEFTARINVLSHPSEIKEGFTTVLDCHSAHIACTIVKLISKVDPRTGKATEVSPVSIKRNDSAVVVFTPKKPLFVEEFHKSPRFGRFAIRDMRATVGAGIIMEVIGVHALRAPSVCADPLFLVFADSISLLMPSLPCALQLTRGLGWKVQHNSSQVFLN